ncbi:hypothetical protein CRG98_011764 [Punica granatum]|uniref:Uncharacterized protein n=1 Tax=Punica granatum TaxID=22663 RepID=A0A2I0KH73_PUNGR|nr:hypothetical protein CRG98_011764 [Punica granatum]
MGRGPLAGGRSGSPGTAAMALRAAILAFGRRDDGTRGFRPILEEIAEIHDLGISGPAGIAGSRRVLPGPARPIFFFLGRRFTSSRSTLPGPARFA